MSDTNTGSGNDNTATADETKAPALSDAPVPCEGTSVTDGDTGCDCPECSGAAKPEEQKLPPPKDDETFAQYATRAFNEKEKAVFFDPKNASTPTKEEAEELRALIAGFLSKYGCAVFTLVATRVGVNDGDHTLNTIEVTGSTDNLTDVGRGGLAKVLNGTQRDAVAKAAGIPRGLLNLLG